MPSTGPDDERIAELEAKLGYKICGAKNRQLKPCSNAAGKGTDHVGEGRCKYHGGRNQSPLAKNFKHGRYAQLRHAELREKMVQLSQDTEVFDLRDEVLKLRSIAEILAERDDDLLATAKVIVDVSKVVERLHNIEVGRRYVISVENVATIIQAVQAVIFRHVPDEFTRHLIATELTGVQLSSRLPKAIEGEVVDASD